MKTLVPIIAAGLALALNTSCYQYAGPNQKTGAVLGAAAGAGVGGIVGNQSGRGLEGAAIGGALGALGGAILGNAYDDVYYRQPAPAPNTVAAPPYPQAAPAPVPVPAPETYYPPASPPLGQVLGSVLSNVSVGYGYSSGGYYGSRHSFGVGINSLYPRGGWGGYRRPYYRRHCY